MAGTRSSLQLDLAADWLGRLCLKHVNRVQASHQKWTWCEMSMPMDASRLPSLSLSCHADIRCLSHSRAVNDVIEMHNKASVGASDYQRAGWVQAYALKASGHFDPSLTWFAYVDGQPVGFCMARARGNRGVIAGLAVMPDYRRRGIGTALMARALHGLAWRGVDAASLYVPMADVAPQALYAKLGFVYVRSGGWGLGSASGTPNGPNTLLGGVVGPLCLAYVTARDRRRANLWRSMSRPLTTGAAAPVPTDLVMLPLSDIRRLGELIRFHNLAYRGASDYEHVGWVEAAALRHSRGFDPGLVWLAHREERLVGYCMARLTHTRARITGLAVLPDCRRQGIGTALTCHAMTELWRMGARTLHLEVPRADVGTHEMYRRLGFVEHDA